MRSSALPVPAAEPPAKRIPVRGVRFFAAPDGMIRLTAIDSRGKVFGELMIRGDAYKERMAEQLRGLLDHHDPICRPVLFVRR